jgi:hypothetical protein
MTTGWVSRIKWLLVLASAIILRSESCGTHDHILLSQIRYSPTWRAKIPYLYPPRTGWAGYTPRHWVAFSSPPTTRRATVEVFDTTSTRVLTGSPKLSSLKPLCTDRVKNTVSKSNSFGACGFVAAGTCLEILCFETVVVYSPISHHCIPKAVHATLCFNGPAALGGVRCDTVAACTEPRV